MSDRSNTEAQSVRYSATIVKDGSGTNPIMKKSARILAFWSVASVGANVTQLTHAEERVRSLDCTQTIDAHAVPSEVGKKYNTRVLIDIAQHRIVSNQVLQNSYGQSLVYSLTVAPLTYQGERLHYDHGKLSFQETMLIDRTNGKITTSFFVVQAGHYLSRASGNCVVSKTPDVRF